MSHLLECFLEAVNQINCMLPVIHSETLNLEFWVFNVLKVAKVANNMTFQLLHIRPWPAAMNVSKEIPVHVNCKDTEMSLYVTFLKYVRILCYA